MPSKGDGSAGQVDPKAARGRRPTFSPALGLARFVEGKAASAAPLHEATGKAVKPFVPIPSVRTTFAGPVGVASVPAAVGLATASAVVLLLAAFLGLPRRNAAVPRRDGSVPGRSPGSAPAGTVVAVRRSVARRAQAGAEPCAAMLLVSACAAPADLEPDTEAHTHALSPAGSVEAATLRAQADG